MRFEPCVLNPLSDAGIASVADKAVFISHCARAEKGF